MQGMSATSGAGIARCPFFNGSMAKPAAEPKAKEASPYQGLSDEVSISPFEPANAGPLTKTCVSSAAKTAMGMLPGVAKAGCPHAA